MKRRLDGLLPLALILTPLAGQMLYLRQYAVNVPFWDQWALIPLLQTSPRQDPWGYLLQLWAQHNEHRILFPKIIFVVLARMTDWNVISEMYFSLALTSMSLVALWLVYRQACKGSLWGFVPISLLVFSLAQWENLLWGWQVQIYLGTLGIILSLHLLSKTSLASTVLAVLCAVVASYSFNTGLVVWPVGILLLLALRANKKQVLLWALSGILVIAAYYADYEAPAHHPSLLTAFSEPFATVRFFLVNVGAPLGGGDINLALVMGSSLLILLTMFVVQKVQLRPKIRLEVSNADYVKGSLVLTSLLSSAAIAMGRVGFHQLELAIASRYTTITSLGIIGIYMLLLGSRNTRENSEVAESRTEKWQLLPAILSLLFVGLFMGNLWGMAMGVPLHEGRLKAKQALQDFEAQPDESLEPLYFPDIVREGAEFLSQNRLGVFAERATLSVPKDSAVADAPLPDSAFRAQIGLEETSAEAEAGEQIMVRAKVKNMSEVTWPYIEHPARHRISLGNHWLDDGGSLIVQDDARAALPMSLKPSEEIELALTVTAPDEPGTYLLELDMVQEMVCWFKERGSETVRIRIHVK